MRISILSVVVFLSGGSALLFQTLWLRLSGLVFGNSIWAAALILSSFMGGLALGSAIAASSWRLPMRPLYFYAVLELAVAFFGCTLVFGLPLLGEWMRPMFQALWEHQGALNGIRFSLSFLILLLPTTAMGLTLPTLLEDPILRSNEFASVIGLLYGWNTLGAVAGAIAGEAYLVAAFGLYGTALTAGAANFAAAAIAMLLAFKYASKSGNEQKISRVREEKNQALLPWRLLILSMGTGGIFLCLEIVWFRFLRLYVSSSSSAFASMLAVVLAGIGCGGITAGVMHRRGVRPNQSLRVLLIIGAIATLLSYIFFPAPPIQVTLGSSYIESWKKIARLSLALIFPVAFLSGILFPVIAAQVQLAVESRMRSTGLTTVFNTLGAAIGTLAASFIFLPSMGFQRTLVLSAVGYAALALLASGRPVWTLKGISNLAWLGLCGVFLLIIIFFPYDRDSKHLAHARQPYEADGSHLIRTIEGNADTLQLLRRDLYGEPYYYRLLTNAYSMSATQPRSQRYMRLFAYLPLTLRPESEDVLLICYGVGVTADAFVRDAHLKRIDMVDVSQEVFDLAGSYTTANYSNPLTDPRVKTFVQDGRFFLQASPRQYDIITGEPPPLKVAGTVNLYTEQFFALMKSRLKTGGIGTFWLPIYQLKVDETKAILRAFHNVFPNSSVWSSSDLEWIMMGINGMARKLGRDEDQRLWTDQATSTDLIRIGMEVPDEMPALFLMDGEEIDRLTAGTKPLTDFYPKRLGDEPANLDTTYLFAQPYMDGASALRRFFSSVLTKNIWPGASGSELEKLFLLRQTRFRSQLAGSNWLAELQLYLQHSHLRTPVLEIMNSDEFRVSIAERFARAAQTLSADARADLIAGALAKRDIHEAILLLEQERNHGAIDLNHFFLLVYLYCLDGKVENAQTLASEKALSLKADPFADWLWKELQAEFGFYPPG